MHLELRYVTRFLYPTPVWDSHNALRARPADTDYQNVKWYALNITPAAKVFTYDDGWGTEVNCFSIADAHEELIVEAIAAVETHPRPQPSSAVPATELGDDVFREDHWSFLRKSAHVDWTSEIASDAHGLVVDVFDVASRIRTIQGFVTDRLEYDPEATVVGTAVAELWRNARGVCQDFSHLTISMLRAVGIPARYVSGFLYAADPSSHRFDEDGEIVVQTHAWVEAAVPGWGWWAVDPTNDTAVGERHVTIGHGRDYEDVMPLRGVFHGDTSAELAVEVTMGPSVLSRSLPHVTVDQ